MQKQILSFNSSTNTSTIIKGTYSRQPPVYIRPEGTFMGNVNPSEIKYFYVPVSGTKTGEVAILLNKTSNGFKGDALLCINILADVSTNFESWNYPTDKSCQIWSAVKDFP